MHAHQNLAAAAINAGELADPLSTDWNGAPSRDRVTSMSHSHGLTSNRDRIREALSYVLADDRDTWVLMAMAVKQALGEEGFDLWNEWSQKSDSYEPAAARATWRSCRAAGRVTIATLFHHAKGNGWRPEGGSHVPSSGDVAQRPVLAAQRVKQETAEVERQRADTARKAVGIWQAAGPAGADHPYLARKQVVPVPTLRVVDAEIATSILGYAPKSGGELLVGQLLVVPIEVEGRLSTLELIDVHGRKTALAGRGTKTGGYWAARPLPESDGAEPLQIGEGAATTLSAMQANGYLSVAALSAGNLVATAAAMRARYPTRPLVLLADLVKATGQPDPRAVEAARASGASLALPDFGPCRAANEKDFNDLLVVRGTETVKEVIIAAQSVSESPSHEVRSHDPAGASVELIRASTIAPQPVSWLWNGWLAQGKLHVFGGAPGTGKTTISMNLAATVSTGGCWPDGSRAPVGDVLIWSGEDSAEDTLVPRLRAAEADLDRIFFIDTLRDKRGQRPFDPARDMARLEEKLRDSGNIRLMIVDPIVSAVSGDSHKSAEVRRALQPLVDLADRRGIALLGITHFSKGTGGRDPVERITGSLAFGALARVVLVAAKRQDGGVVGEASRVFLRAKSNVGPDSGGFGYDLQQDEVQGCSGIVSSLVVWGHAIEGEAREILESAESSDDDGEGGTLVHAKRFLAGLLEGGPVCQPTIKRDAEGAGYSWATIRRAKKALGVEAVKTGMHEGWEWMLPPRCAT